MKFIIKYLSHIIFACLLAYYAVLAYVADVNPITNQMMMVIVSGFWILWVFAKSFLKIIAAIALLGAMCFAGYYIIHAEEIECKKAGKEWNEKTQTCEEKKTTGEKLKSAISDMIKSTLNKWRDSKIKEDIDEKIGKNIKSSNEAKKDSSKDDDKTSEDEEKEEK